MSTTTEKIIYEMITEDTGKHFMDSGGDNGRHWQRNKTKSIEDFENEKLLSFDIDNDTTFDKVVDNIWDHFSSSTYKHLTEYLEYDESITNELNQYLKENDLYNNLAGVDEFIEMREGNNKVAWELTFNHENIFTQDFQFAWSDNGDIYNVEYIILATHNGADVRGGYSDYKVFKITDEMFWFWDLLDSIKYDIDQGEYKTLEDLKRINNN